MSSTQSRSYTFDSSNGSSEFTTSTSDLKKSYSSRAVGFFSLTGSATSGYAQVTGSNAKNALFPNSTASPIKMDVSAQLVTAFSTSDSSYITFVVDSQTIFKHIPHSQGTSVNKTGLSGTAISSMKKSSSIRYDFVRANNRVGITIDETTITLYFTRYDFSASAGANVTSASVSSSTGYDGDTIQYRCTLAAGAEWQGWYRNGALYSATKDLNVTVSGTDLALEARATMPVTTKTLSAAYNGAQLQGFPISVQADAAITYGGVSKGAVPLGGGAKMLTCANKLCSGNIGIGGKTLMCEGKVMSSDVVAMIDVNMLDPAAFTLNAVTMSGGVYTFTPSATAMINQPLPAPTAGHKYYGRCQQKAPSGYSAADSRFEYYRIDGENLVFGNMDSTPKDGQWHLLSDVLSFSSVSSASGWVLRSFTVAGTANAYRKEMMIIDLTAVFGSGNEPDKAWCDANMIYSD